VEQALGISAMFDKTVSQHFFRRSTQHVLVLKNIKVKGRHARDFHSLFLTFLNIIH
jgi:hypothetical protein